MSYRGRSPKRQRGDLGVQLERPYFPGAYQVPGAGGAGRVKCSGKIQLGSMRKMKECDGAGNGR